MSIPAIPAPKLLICGRTASGKSLFAKLLQRKEPDLHIAESYTTRPKRRKNEKGHIFINAQKALEIENKFCKTAHNGYEYFLTEEEILKSDIIILDPSGVDEIVNAFPNFMFRLVYVHSLDEEKRKLAYCNRTDDPNKKIQLEEEYNERNIGEDPQFTELENIIVHRAGTLSYDNIQIAHLASNDYTDKSDIYSCVDDVYTAFVLARRLGHIVADIIKKSTEEGYTSLLSSIGLNYDKNTNMFTGESGAEAGKMTTMRPAELVESLCHDKTGFYCVVGSWLSLPEQLDIINPAFSTT